ncbi:C2 domain [Arabidopsis thaliana x Arabidopsis arenosa]|uniref:C2 domain n=1 Tax=Arabidopsis thaliana x Arabidopsis arenosa TaxID=1240361 RepID=A0A8T1Z5D0_9BRAS|nr:C2 domain [Arabidopsis thaliana x Arabidopsis arenosa]
MTRKIQITAISAEDLVDGRKPVDKNAFVAFNMAGNNWKQPMRTSLDEVGGNHPMWEDKLETEFSSEKEPTSVMYVQVYHRSSGKDKHVGTARVPVKEFTGEYAPEGFMHCLSYRLWDEQGRRNGIVNFSVRILPNKSDTTKSGLVPPFWLRVS